MNDYVGKIGNDMCYPKPTEPQAPPVKSKTPTEELDDIITAFDNVDVRKISDGQLQKYFDVAYESYVYAETIIDHRRRKRGKR